MAEIYQDRKTGQRVRRVGSESGKEEFVMVRANAGEPYYASLSRLVPCDEKGVPDYEAELAKPEELEPAMPDPVIDLVETRLNINVTSAEELAKKVPGLQYRTALAIKKLQLTMPGERFRTLDQIRQVSSRVNWDKLLTQNLIFVQ